MNPSDTPSNANVLPTTVDIKAADTHASSPTTSNPIITTHVNTRSKCVVKVESLAEPKSFLEFEKAFNMLKESPGLFAEYMATHIVPDRVPSLFGSFITEEILAGVIAALDYISRTPELRTRVPDYIDAFLVQVLQIQRIDYQLMFIDSTTKALLKHLIDHSTIDGTTKKRLFAFI